MKRSISVRGITLALIVAALAACGADTTATPDPSPTETPSSIAAADVTPILATTELRTGTQRVAFILEGSSRLVTTPSVTIATSQGGATGQTVEAPFRKWPFGTRGSYAAELTFPTAGEWLLEVTSDGIDGAVPLTVDVAEESVVADIGQLAPFSNTKTLASADGDLGSITSHSQADPDLYQLSVVDALISGRPSVVVFASPAFCTSPTCGPEVETVIELKDAYQEQANFIHVEVYDNPDEIQGDLSRAELSPHLAQWGIDQVEGYRNESWTFVLGRDGRITQRFEGYATYEEIEEALLAALG